MHKVFINYRTGDGDEAAALVETALSHRFGSDRIFRAAKSIPPGEPFSQTLLDAVRSSTALLAIIGPEWQRHPRLQDENDWVRREIVEAYAHGVTVIPVLKGRKMDRLEKSDLPPDLSRLADAQSLRLDTRDNGSDLARIGDELALRVPGFAEIDRGAGPAESETPAQPSTAPASPSTTVPGGAGTLVTGYNRNVHTGKGDINERSPRFSGDGARYVEGDVHGDVN